MKKSEVVATILGKRRSTLTQTATAFAASNIALCKYWGKRDQELNIPLTSSLSISLGNKGATCTISAIAASQDHFLLNKQVMANDSSFTQRMSSFLDLFRPTPTNHFQLEMTLNIPLAAGLASSACGFAAVVLALNDFFAWKLNPRELSILARLGSGSACRSIFSGFVEWHAGVAADGMDSYAEPISANWPDLAIGLLIVSRQEKPLASRAAMERTVATSALYAAWPNKVNSDLKDLKVAIANHDFALLGKTAESNALHMHALMLSAWPPISYAIPDTLIAMQKIWSLRQQGLAIYFTQDAGPNLKLLFLKKDQAIIQAHFKNLEVVE